jgi:hypothetical protein
MTSTTNNGFFDKKKFLLSCVIEPSGYIFKENPTMDELDCEHNLYRLQRLCEAYDIYPNYFVNYQMVLKEDVQEFIKDVHQKKKAEVGTYVTPWHTPPYTQTDSESRNYPLLTNYESDVIKKKIYSVNDALVQKCGIEPKIHKSAQFAMDSRLMRILQDEFDFVVDSTIPTGLNLCDRGRGDYLNIQRKPFFFKEYSSKLGDKVLEIPVSTIKPEEVDDFLDYMKNELDFSDEDLEIATQYSSLITGPLRVMEKSLIFLPMVNNYICDREDGNSAVQMVMSSADTSGVEFFKSNEKQEILYSVLGEIFESNKGAGIESCTMSKFYDEYKKK